MDTIEVQAYTHCVNEHIVDSSIDHWRIRTENIEFLVSCVDVLQESDVDQLTVEWLCSPETLKQLEKDFIVATKISELVANNRVSIRTSTRVNPNTPTLLLSKERVINLLGLDGGEAVQIEITDEDISHRLWEKYRSEWEMGMPESIDTPPYSRLLALAEHKLGADIRTDIATAYSAMESRTPGDRPEPVTVGLLVGAKHDLLLRDVVEWAETSTLATQGTVSKLKQQLEHIGVIATESENIGVGRPRQRLTLADESFESLSADELVANVQSVLAGTR